MSKILNWFQDEYEKIQGTNMPQDEKDLQYAGLMSEMEQEFQIPALRNPEWEQENRAIITLYKKISMSRKLGG